MIEQRSVPSQQSASACKDAHRGVSGTKPDDIDLPDQNPLHNHSRATSERESPQLVAEAWFSDVDRKRPEAADRARDSRAMSPKSRALALWVNHWVGFSELEPFQASG